MELTAKQVAAMAGVTYRVLDYWDRTGVLVPSIAQARGTGSQRIYSQRDAMVGRVLAHLVRLGAQVPALKQVSRFLTALPENEWWGLLVVDPHGRAAIDAPISTGAWVVSLSEAVHRVDPMVTLEPTARVA